MKWLRGAVMIGLCYLILCLGMSPERCMVAAAEALSLCVTSVIPALFPFFVCSSLLVALGGAEICGRALSGIMRPVFKVGGSGALALVLGIVSGYPVGAGCAAELYNSGRISKAEAERLLGFCNNSGPLFIIGTVGFALSGGARLGGILYLIHIASALAAGVILARIVRDEAPVITPGISEVKKPPAARLASAFGNAVSKGVITVLNVCGFVVFFKVLECALPDFGGSVFLNPLLEITGGIAELSKTALAPSLKFSLISMFLAFSGLSVFFQTSSILEGSGLSMKYYVVGKLIHGLLAFLISMVVLPLLGVGAGWAGAFVPGPDMSEYSMYLYAMPDLDIKRYLILVAGEIVWCGLIVGGLWLAAKLIPESD